MGKKVEPPKEAGVPAYFVQYAALWCLMLAFFVVLLSMGHERTAEFKSGMGLIRDAFGLKGGFGMMQYWRKSSQGYGDNNPQSSKSKEDGDIIGYFKGMLWKEGLSSVSIMQTRFDDRGISITLASPLNFDTNSAVLGRDAQLFLNRMGGVFYNLTEAVVTVECLDTQGREDARSLLATERAVAISRYLRDECQLPGNRIEAIGYSHQKYLTALGTNQPGQVVLFSIRKINEKAAARSQTPPS